MRQKLFIMCLGIFIQATSLLYAKESPCISTYFSYSTEEIEQLSQFSSHFEMKRVDLKKWDQIAAQEIDTDRFSYLKSVRIYTYLYMAQKEAASLSYLVKGSFEGSLDPISNATLALFTHTSVSSELESDPYSIQLGNIVLAKIWERVDREDHLPYAFKVPDSYLLNKETSYTEGNFIAKWIPWYTQPENAYWALPPPPQNDPQWKNEICKIKQAQQPMTDEKREIIHFWAGLKGKDSGNWRIIANQYMFSHEIPFTKMLQARSVLMVGIYDSTIVCFGGKYHYSMIRPQVYDHSITYMIIPPNHPSYPSGHSTESTVASTILSHYFPQKSEYWHQLAKEGRISRIWAGIHYPIDDRGGVESGKKIAEKILKEQESNFERCTKQRISYEGVSNINVSFK